MKSNDNKNISSSVGLVQRKIGIKGMYLNTFKAIYEKPIANIILKEEKLKPLPLMKQE
jgi:hypothetical protein